MLTNFIILVLLICCACLYFQQKQVLLKCSKKQIDKFEPEDQYLHESMNVFKDVKFSLSCCPSTYSSDKGCACIENENDVKINKCS